MKNPKGGPKGNLQGISSLIICCGLLIATGVSALDRIEARSNGSTSMSGRMAGATDFQFGVHVRGTQDQKIEQLERELRLLRFSRDEFPALSSKISYSGTNVPISRCLADLSKSIGKSIPMDFGTNDFKAREFVFEEITLMDALKYLVAFDDAILDVRGEKLVREPVRQALLLNEPDYKLLRLMATRRFKEVEMLLKEGNPDVRKLKDQDEHTLLHLAAANNQTAIAERLIALGPELNAKDNVGYTPLHEAVRDGHERCVELLLRHGANTSLRDNNNSTPLQTAIYFGYTNIANLLVSNGAPVDIFTASGLGMTDRVKKMLDDGVDYRKEREEYYHKQAPDGVFVGGLGGPASKEPGSYFGVFSVSPLHWAARGGSVEVAKLLISRGEAVSLTDSSGKTPLFWAVESGKPKMVEFLIQSGANVNATNRSGGTPLLDSARSTDSPEQMKLLIAAGANVNARDSNGENALHKLAWFGYPKKNVETAQQLLDAGTDIHAKDMQGRTPLDILLDNSFQNPDLVKLYRAYAGRETPKR